MSKLAAYCVCVLAIILLLNSGCENSVVNNPNVVFPDSLVSFSKHVMPYVAQTCGLQDCHGPGLPKANVLLADWESIIMAYNGTIVIPGNPNGSLLVQMLEYTLPHNPMLYWNASDNQKKGIRQWIKEGAQKN